MITVSLLGAVLTALILVPGYIHQRFVHSYLVLHRQESASAGFIGIAIPGLWNLVLSWPVLVWFGIDPVAPVLSSDDLQATVQAFRLHGVAWVALILICPVCLAIATAWFHRRGWVSTVLRWVGLESRIVARNALESALLLHQEVDVLASIMMRSGDMLYGRIGPDAFASSADGAGLFLDRVYALDDDGDLVPDRSAYGIYIPHEQIAWCHLDELGHDIEIDEEETELEGSS